MASGSDDLVAQFEKFCSLASSGKDKTNFTSKASGKLTADCWQAKYGKFDVKTITDASVFPVCKDKGKPSMTVNKANIDKYITKSAHEIAKRKTKNTKMAENDPEVASIKEDLINCLCKAAPNVKEVKQSATGNVGGLTDASKYTGAHKERFDASGKGKGIEGRQDRADNSGYVGNYKGEGSYGKK